MLPIEAWEVRQRWFNSGYDHGNMEQSFAPPPDAELQPPYKEGYTLGSRHRQERHQLRAAVQTEDKRTAIK
jgi:hypothetical protein